jgi:prepilin-type processing-associated H-X9-DG protein
MAADPTPVTATKGFDTPEAALKALAVAFAAPDTKPLESLLGPDVVNELMDDTVKDAKLRQMEATALAKAQARFRDEKKDCAVFVRRDVPVVPIPIVKTSEGWRFKCAAAEVGDPRERLNLLRCQRNLSMLVKRSYMFADSPANKGLFPQEIQALYPEYIEAEDLFQCPAVTKHGEGAGKLKSCDFVYIGGIEAEGAGRDKLVVAFDRKVNHPNGRNVAFADSHVEYIADDAEFKTLVLATLKAQKLSLELPKLDANTKTTDEQKAKRTWVETMRKELGLQ